MVFKIADIEATMAENYTNMKTDVVKIIMTSNTLPENYVQKLLSRFLEFISSPRDLSRIRTSRNLALLFSVLEYRDWLSPQDVSLLSEAAQVLGCSDALRRINDYKATLQIATSAKCEICGNEEACQRVIRPLEPLSPPKAPRHRCVDEPSPLGVDEAIERIRRRLGRSWKNLARTKEFGFNEYEIQGIEDDFKYSEDMIRHMFIEWKEREGKRATVLRLSKALLSARRRDLADRIDDADFE